MFCCLFVKSEGLKRFIDNNFYYLKVIKLSLEWPWSDVYYFTSFSEISPKIYKFVEKLILFTTRFSKISFISVTIFSEKILILIFEDFCWKYIYFTFENYFLSGILF